MEPSMQRDVYMDCITKQLKEVDMLSIIYASPGEIRILDPGVISDFHEFLATRADATAPALKAHLDYIIKVNIMINNCKEKLEIRIELPHLYPALEHAIVSIDNPLLSNAKDHFKQELERFIATMEPNETYIFQVATWIADNIEGFITRNTDELQKSSNSLPDSSQTATTAAKMETTDEPEPSSIEVKFENFERLWIYLHHLKSKTKRQDIVKLARDLDLSGFSRPGKPGILCVEGSLDNTQKFWKVIKTWNWQKIVNCKSEVKRKPLTEFDQLRRFQGFKEQIFGDDLDKETCVRDMGWFIKYLELHKSGYMKKELFGLE